MSSDQPQNGADAPAEGTDPTREQILDAMRAEISMSFGMLLGLFAPNTPQDEFPVMVEKLLEEQLTIQEQILPVLLGQPGQFHIDVRSRNGSQGRFTAERLLGAAKGDCGKALSTALVYALLLQPSVRGLLRVHGVAYQFVAPPPKPDPQLILLK